MRVVKYPKRELWFELLGRPVINNSSLNSTVSKVLEDIKLYGDEAVERYSKQFDGVSLSSTEVTEHEFLNAKECIEPELIESIDVAIKNITLFHKAQISKEINVDISPGVTCWQKPVAIEKVGLYIPGGTAPLFSTVLMLGIPAKIAGCKEIVLCTPPLKDGSINPEILYCAGKIGITKVFKVGGVQAIGAMAYGTDTIPKVYKLFGPGNQYVTAAKQIVARDSVAIDMPAGPSEVAVLGDNSSNPVFIAYDLLSQAEHGKDSQVLFISKDEEIIDKVAKQVEIELEKLPRKDFAKASLENSRLILVRSENEMMDMMNDYAPEHLIISTSNADELASKVINAGSVFIGNYTPESAGDYASGTNHTLPTHGWAKSYSGVNLDSYIKKITFQKITKEGIKNLGPIIENMAEAESLNAHCLAVTKRIEEN